MDVVCHRFGILSIYLHFYTLCRFWLDFQLGILSCSVLEKRQCRRRTSDIMLSRKNVEEGGGGERGHPCLTPAVVYAFN